MKWRAEHPSGSTEYYQEPYTVQHFIDFVADVTKLWCWEFPIFVFRHFTSKKFRMKVARTYNDALFGNIPTSQIYQFDGNEVRKLRPEERTWPETRHSRALDEAMIAKYGPEVVSVEELAYGLNRVQYRDGRIEELA